MKVCQVQSVMNTEPLIILSVYFGKPGTRIWIIPIFKTDLKLNKTTNNR